MIHCRMHARQTAHKITPFSHFKHKTHHTQLSACLSLGLDSVLLQALAPAQWILSLGLDSVLLQALAPARWILFLGLDSALLQALAPAQ